ncbi:hypothetical protein NPS01_36410 [Nocardioides psychrotolerans]|uniref:hypothetical protein n=1 Tax=Nocardioides psychrotolerans TaxID=1005945 RepID=UPI000B83528A|nr:hypothetical protein [Nocardioides psychrotolerans]GEP39978.1 hypothetical protein NPS01_36410 [Nocardioides psychrotolerans]
MLHAPSRAAPLGWTAPLDVRRRPRQILTFSQGAHLCREANAWAEGAYVRRPTGVPFRVST